MENILKWPYELDPSNHDKYCCKFIGMMTNGNFKNYTFTCTRRPEYYIWVYKEFPSNDIRSLEIFKASEDHTSLSAFASLKVPDWYAQDPVIEPNLTPKPIDMSIRSISRRIIKI